MTVRDKLVARVVAKMTGGRQVNNVVPIQQAEYWRVRRATGLGNFNWGSFVSEIVGKVGDIHVNRAAAKAQAKAANAMADAEARLMLAEVEAQMALTQSLEAQTRLAKEQKDLQAMIKSIEFSGVYKIAIGVGVAGLIVFLVLGAKKRGRSR